MNLRASIRTALISIGRNKMRSLLTTLGVVIGVLSVILLTSIGNGLKVYIEEQFEGLGSNIVIVTPGEIVSEGGGFSGPEAALSFAASKLTQEDAIAIERVGYPITAAVPIAETTAEIRSNRETKQTFIAATTPEYSVIRNTKAEQGRFLSDADMTGRRKVVVIGHKIAEDLFPGTDPVGQQVTINRVRFEVVGVAEQKTSGGGFGGPDFDSLLYIPITTGKVTFGLDKVVEIHIQSRTKEDIPSVKSLTEKVLAKRLDDGDFSVTDQTDILKTIQSILSVLTAGLAGIAAISLIVGGIGIMNIMLVAVTERTREIGLRKAVGATPNNILVQFLIEAVTLATVGGILGVVLGIAGALAVRRFFPATPSLNSILLAFFVSFATGVIFGVFPARKASRLSPIEALRYE